MAQGSPTRGPDSDRPWKSLPRTAVFIDGDWLVHASRRLEQAVDFAKLLQSFRDSFGVSVQVRIYLSVRSGSTSHERFVTSLQALGYEVSTTPVVERAGRFFSKELDVQLASDAVGLPQQVDRLVLVSGDNDFVSLLRAAAEQRRSNVLITLPLVTGRALAEAADYRATLEDLLQAAKPTGPEGPVPRVLLPESRLPRESYIEKGSHIGSYRLLRDLVAPAQYSVTMIDAYVNDEMLFLLEVLKPTVRTLILTDKIAPPDFPNIVRRLRREGRHIDVYRTRLFHDRFLQVDDQWWHSGHSFKDLGSRDSRISKISDKRTLETLPQRIADAMKTATDLCPTRP